MKTLYIRTERGFATLIALMAMIMLTMLGLAALYVSDDEVSIAGNELQEMRAFMAAEAGLEKAVAELHWLYDSTGAPPTNMPSGIDSMNHCIVWYITTDDGPPQQRNLISGTLMGMHALVKTFSIISTAVSSIDGAKVEMSETFQTAMVPIFQYTVFYDNDLEISPGPPMTLGGRVHTNGNLYLQSGGGLQIDGFVTAAGNIIHGPKGPIGVSNGDVEIRNAIGDYVSMQDASGWLDSQDSYWYDSSAARWQGRVQDSTHGQAKFNVPLNGSSDDPRQLIERATGNPSNTDSYEHKATLKIIDGEVLRLVGGVWDNVTAQFIADGIMTVTSDQFVDQRENKNVDVTDLDIALLYQYGYAPANHIIYFSDIATGDYPALRINNGVKLDDALTVVSENPVYVNGDYNSDTKKPAAIIADAVTFLSTAWSAMNYDANSGNDKSNRPAAETIVNASIMSGNTETTSTNYNGGFENLPRFLEDWTGKNFIWTGSMVNLWNSVQADGDWNGSYYTPPNRDWSYDPDLDDPNKIPPGTPMVRVFQRLGWSQEYVGLEPVAADTL